MAKESLAMIAVKTVAAVLIQNPTCLAIVVVEKAVSRLALHLKSGARIIPFPDVKASSVTRLNGFR